MSAKSASTLQRKYAQRNKTIVVRLYICLRFERIFDFAIHKTRHSQITATPMQRQCILPWKSAVGRNTFRRKQQKEWKQRKKIILLQHRRYSSSIAMQFVRLHKSKSSWFPRDVVTLNSSAHDKTIFFLHSTIKNGCWRGKSVVERFNIFNRVFCGSPSASWVKLFGNCVLHSEQCDRIFEYDFNTSISIEVDWTNSHWAQWSFLNTWMFHEFCTSIDDIGKNGSESHISKNEYQ